MSSELNGILVVDKPEGLSSAGVVSRIKKLIQAKKVGHTGTLDPFATGVLICCINRATKLSRFFLKGDKGYEAEMVLGITTDTQDATGSIIAERPVDKISTVKIQETTDRFVGTITQVPPVYSALKHQGTPLYKLARRGQAVEKPARSVRIHKLTILEIRLPVIRFVVSCSSGTYIRTLCSDLGEMLGVGAHLKTLRRITSSCFTIDDAKSLEELAHLKKVGGLNKVIVSMSEALPFMPAAVAGKPIADKIKNGVKLFRKDLPMPPQLGDQGAFKVIDPDGRLVAILEPSTTMDSYNYCCVF
jgi:tRNA pseudouridine55 synthase